MSACSALQPSLTASTRDGAHNIYRLSPFLVASSMAVAPWCIILFVLSCAAGHVDPSADNVVSTSSVWSYSLFPFQVFNAEAETRIIGGEAIRRPCCTSSGSGRVDCFILGPDSTLRHQRIEGDESSTWDIYPFSTGIVESFTCIRSMEDRIDIIYVDQTGVLHTGWYTGGIFKEIKHTGAYMEAPSCSLRRPGVVDCLIRNIKNSLYHIIDLKGDWSKPQPVKKTTLKYLPSCYPESETQLMCLGSSYQNRLYLARYDEEEGWSDWEAFGEIWVKGKPFLTAFGDRMFGLVHGQGNDYIGLLIGDPGAESLSGDFTSDPECLLSPDGKTIHCFGVGLESHLYHNAYTDERWTGLHDLGGAYIEAPSCTIYNDKKIACYIRGFGKDIIEVMLDT